MRAQVFIDHTEGGFVEVSVVKHGLSSGAGHRYNAVGEAKAVLLAFGFDAGLVDHQLGVLAEMPPSALLRFPVADIADDVLRARASPVLSLHQRPKGLTREIVS